MITSRAQLRLAPLFAAAIAGCGDDSVATTSGGGGDASASSASTTQSGPTTSSQGTGAGGDATGGSNAGGGEAGGAGGAGGSGAGGGPILLPGSGFDDETDVPPPVGSGPGVGRTVIAHWDAVPYVTVDGLLNVGVLAYHVNGIDRVEMSLDGGPWVPIPEATLNPATDVVEYWATLDASLTTDGPHEIRAIAHPRVGQAAVLQGTVSGERSSLLLSTNASGSLPAVVRFARAGGDDSSDCLSIETACATIAGALASIGDDVDGAEIHLGEGDWTLPETGEAFHNETRWLTIRGAETAAPGSVRIAGVDGRFDGAGLHVKLLRLSDVALIGSIDKAVAGGFEDYLWVDRSEVYSTNPNAIEIGGQECFSIQGYDLFTGVWVTDVHMDNMCNGPINTTLARDVYAEHTAAGHSSGSATVVNYTVEFVYGSTYMPGWPDYHGDVYQMFQRAEDIVIYGARTVPDSFISSRGIVGSSAPIRDVAMDHVDLEIDGWVFSYCATASGPTIEHMIIQDSRFVGSSNWCGEAPGAPAVDPNGIVDVLIANSVFENGSPEQVPQPWDLPGIRYEPPLE